MAGSTNVCGTGGWTGALPGDPDNNSVLSATPAFGGIDVSWTYPVLNPQAVAHTILYRGLTNSFAAATQRGVVSGNFFYDKTTMTVPVAYFYWIKIVSVNGTEGALIGPATTTALPTIDQMIVLLTGKIDASVLAQSLKTDIDKIALVGQDLITEVRNRFAANTALGATLDTLRIDTTETVARINSERTSRISADSALVTYVDSVVTGLAGNSAALVEERVIRTSKDAALAQDVSTLYTNFNNNTSAIISEQNARASADSAEASSRNTLAARLDTALGQNQAAITAEAQVRSSADAASVSKIESLSARLGSRQNLVTNGSFENKMAGWIGGINLLRFQDSLWGACAVGFNIQGTNAITQSKVFIVQPGEFYTITGDSLLLNHTGGYVYFDIQWLSSTNVVISDSTQSIDGSNHDFSTTDTNRNTHAVAAQAPANAAYGCARFVWENITGSAAIVGCRQIKVERGGLPATPYSFEASIASAYTDITVERNARVTADTAEAAERNTLAALVSTNNSANISAIQNEATARANADTAEANARTTLASSVAVNNTNQTAAIQSEASTRASADSAEVSARNTLSATVDSNNSAQTAAVSSEANTRSLADTALADQITTAQSTLNGQISSVQTTLQTNINTTNGKVTDIGALYTARVSVNGLIGGFGVYNDGAYVSAGFDVDTLWVGRTSATNGKKPFIVDSVTGQTFIDKAVINSASIANARINYAQINTASIGSLSSLSATIGTLRTATTGARLEISDNVIKVFDTNGNIRVKLGNLSL